MTSTPAPPDPAMPAEEYPLEQIALNAIRWRARDDNDGKAMAQGDRRWLLRYIDRHSLQEPTP